MNKFITSIVRVPSLTSRSRFLVPNRNSRLVTFFTSSKNGRADTSSSSSSSSSSQQQGQGHKTTGENSHTLWVSGATMATLVMLGLLHARRLYDDNQLEVVRDKGIEIEFSPDAKASLLRLLPLRSISRIWGFITNVEYPIWLRPYIYKAWARAFHSDLEEAALPLDHYASLRDFFVRTLKEGSRQIDPDPHCLVSPVDGTILKFGELKDSEAMIEQVKGFSYSASSLLGTSSFLPVGEEDIVGDCIEENNIAEETSKKSWWRISFASPQVRDPTPVCRRMKGIFYCVIYLKPGDYHRVHSPVDCSILLRRHFSGRLFPVNERATRTIRNLYVQNERVVLEGRWAEGFFALAAIGATNIGSIELLIEPELRTNKLKKILHTEPPKEREYEPQGVGVMLKKGDEIAAFNMGSTVVLIFQAPISKSKTKGQECDGCDSSVFNFCVQRGDKIRLGEALGRWSV